MKNFIVSLLITLLMTQTLAMADTTPPVAVPVRIVYSAGNSVGLVNWRPLLNLTAKGVKGVQVQDTSGYTMEVGVTYYGAPANSEVSQFLVPATSVNTFYPMEIAAGMRVSVRGKGSTAISGEGNYTVFYY